MKRYYLSKKDAEGTPYVVQHPGVNAAAINSDSRNWCLCIVGAADHSLLADDPNVIQLPDAGRDVLWLSVSATVKNAVTSALNSWGISASVPLLTGTYGDWLTKLGRMLDPAADLDKLDCSDSA